MTMDGQCVPAGPQCVGGFIGKRKVRVAGSRSGREYARSREGLAVPRVIPLYCAA
jgi:hypothetical protein